MEDNESPTLVTVNNGIANTNSMEVGFEEEEEYEGEQDDHYASSLACSSINNQVNGINSVQLMNGDDEDEEEEDEEDDEYEDEEEEESESNYLTVYEIMSNRLKN